MKLSTTTQFTHSLIVPKGFKFKSSINENFENIIGLDICTELLNNNTVLRWTDIHINHAQDLTPDFWDKHLKDYLVEINNITING